MEMERGRGGTPFLANHGYVVSTLSDDEEDYWSEAREERYTETMWSPEILDRNNCSWNDFEHQSHHFSCSNTDHTDRAADPQHSNIMYLSQSQHKKSRACSEASKYSLQRSHELLMARSIHADPKEPSESPSVQSIGKKSLKESDTRLEHYTVTEPTREFMTSTVTANPGNLESVRAIYGGASNWTRNLEDAVGSCNDYPDPIDMDLYYNHPQRTSLHEAKKLKMKVHNNHYKITSNYESSELAIVDWEDEIRHADTDAYDSHSAVTQLQRVCKDLNMDPTVYPFRKTTYDQRDDISSPKQKQFRSLRRSQECGLQGSKKRSTNVNSPMLRSLDPVESCCTISERERLSRVSEHVHDFPQKFHDSNDDQITCQEKESRMQDTVPVSSMMRRKQMRSSHPRQGYSKRQHQEARHDKGDTRRRCEQVPPSLASPRAQKYREDIWTLANTEVAYNHGSLQAPCLARQGVNGDQRNAFWTSQSPVKSQATTRTEHFNVQKNVGFGITDTSPSLLGLNVPDYITASERENSEGTELRNSKMVKIGVPASNQTVKDKLLSIINLTRRVRQNSTQSNASERIANELGEEDKSLDAESPHSKCLRERQLQTLNVIDYTTPERDERTIYRLVNRTEGIHRPGVDETCDRKGMAGNIALSSDVIASENSRTNVNTCKRKDGAFSNFLPGKENTDQTENRCVLSGLVEKESIENRKLPAPSSVNEDKRLQVSIYSTSQQGEETNIEVQEQSKEPGLIVESNSRDMIQVDVKAPEPYTELALQSNRLLKLLRDLQVQRPAPGKCYENTSIIGTKTEGMMDAAPKCGYLAQYLKMQNIGKRGNRRLLTTRR